MAAVTSPEWWGCVKVENVQSRCSRSKSKGSKLNTPWECAHTLLMPPPFPLISVSDDVGVQLRNPPISILIQSTLLASNPTLASVDSESDAELARFIWVDESGGPIHHVEGHAGRSAGAFLGAAPVGGRR